MSQNVPKCPTQTHRYPNGLVYRLFYLTPELMEMFVGETGYESFYRLLHPTLVLLEMSVGVKRL